MKFGYFDDQQREYVITTPRTPYPWINFLGNDDFFSIISNTAGGYSFYKDARLRRITRYRYNNVPLDDGGKYFYINDSGDVWSPGWKPVKRDLDFYECRHGLSYTRITGRRNALQADILYFVPLKFQGEVQRVRLTNTGQKNKTIQLFSFVEWCLWNALDDMTNFQRNLSTGEVEIDGSVIYHKTEYRERRHYYAFYGVNAEICGFDSDRETFLGMYNGFDAPQTVLQGRPANSIAHGWSPVASHCVQIDLKPGEKKELVFILGYAENEENDKFSASGVLNKTKAREMLQQYATVKQVDEAFGQLKAYWDQLLSIFQLNHAEEKLNRMVNIWNPYQCMITFNFSRSASYFESGIGRGMGFRDSNQDLLGFVHQIPAKARQRIIDIASTQFEDGGAYHQYQPLTKRGNHEIGGNFNDDPLWLIASTVAYLKETSDFSILGEAVPFDHDPQKAATLFEHLKRSFYHVVHHRGPHGLPLIGRADWNDCLNLNCFSIQPDEPFQTTENRSGGQAESVFIAGMFMLYGGDFAHLCRYLGKNNEAEQAEKYLQEMQQAIDQYGWDGDWFLRAYDFLGDKVGSKECEEGKIFIEPQGMCIMAGLGLDDGRAEKALTAVKTHLDCPYGIVLQQPAFSKYILKYGEISTYPPGYKENAGVFCHNNPWIMIAETKLGHGDQAFEYYRKIAPAYLEEISELHKTEPYVYSQMIAGKDAAKPGEAKNAWLTGTAAWNFHALTEHILGIKPLYDGLMIDPCIPQSWEGYSVTRVFREVIYRIEIRNPHHVCHGVSELTVDGKVINGNILPIYEKGSSHNVIAELGTT